MDLKKRQKTNYLKYWRRREKKELINKNDTACKRMDSKEEEQEQGRITHFFED